MGNHPLPPVGGADLRKLNTLIHRGGLMSKEPAYRQAGRTMKSPTVGGRDNGSSNVAGKQKIKTLKHKIYEP